MSLISLRAYYHYCPATIRDLVSYPRTVAEPGIASLATATGKCISHAILNGDDSKYLKLELHRGFVQRSQFK